MNHCIKKIEWEEILPIWEKDLWPNRKSEITPTSAMCLSGKWKITENSTPEFIEQVYDLKNMEFSPTFWGYIIGDDLIGVNSGHMCLESQYRSRGLFVYPEYRGLGIGTKLLQKTMAQGYSEKAILSWSYPRETSWKSYHRAGYITTNNLYNFDFKKDEETNTFNTKCFFEF
jgi:GNAT superfamily N-acetyltransferase